jgi:hypothetical protein
MPRMANEIRRVVTDYGVDPYGAFIAEELTGEVMARLVGYGGHVYTGDKGDLASGQAYGGVLPSPQRFVGAAAPFTGNPITLTDASPTIDTAAADSPLTDPVARILAQRLRAQGG